jgi:formylglycine-generating enzyme
MVWVPGGEFSMGAEDPRGIRGGGMQSMEDSRPIHRVYVDGFWMDTTDVTNEQFAAFVKATGYVTIAERTPTRAEFPEAPAENLVAGAVVYSPTTRPVALDDYLQWWSYVPGADWRHPEGPNSDLKGREKYPVVQVAYDDAVAYAKWAGKRLPTEAEWEFAARGGLAGKRFVWGNQLKPGGKWQANTFQGKFPVQGGDTGEDGFKGIAPVAQYRPNPYGLYDMAGNVWQWCSDWYRADYYSTLAAQGGVARNPQGPADSFDPSEPGQKKRVQRGGSFLCNDQYCSRYVLGSRGKGESSSSANHLGFRCVMERNTRAVAVARPPDYLKDACSPLLRLRTYSSVRPKKKTGSGRIRIVMNATIGRSMTRDSTQGDRRISRRIQSPITDTNPGSPMF